MLRENGYKISECGYLVYWYPSKVMAPKVDTGLSVLGFGVAVYELASSAEKGKEVLVKAAECLRGEKRPEPSSDCEHCQHITKHIVRKEEERNDENSKASQ